LVRDDGPVIEGIDEFVAGPTFMTSWAELAAELELEPEPAHDIGFDLAACHTEPHRHYHTTEHITAVLRHLDDLHASTPTARLAAFFHDAVYDPARSDNEAQSAELAREVLKAVERPEADDVAAIVLATAKHELPTDAPRDTAAFLDADLAILAARPEVYDTYTANVRAEYSHIADAEFRSGRQAILEGFLQRDRLFFTTAGQARFDVPARANLRREIAQLSTS
jgi:predicted metal-dependent HD superfamily phosphohydrolase